jgi:hypothetical protein
LPDLDTAAKRSDGCAETSINYEDDHGAARITRADKANAKFGIARLPLRAIDILSMGFGTNRLVLHHERQPKDNNRYHGNILFVASLPKNQRNALAAMLAANAEVVPEEEAATVPFRPAENNRADVQS